MTSPRTACPLRGTRRRAGLAALALASTAVLAACGGGSGFEEEGAGGGAEGPTSGDGQLEVLIASSGDAETKVVQDAADAWAQESGNQVKVVVAQDINQELSQGFASSSPPRATLVPEWFGLSSWARRRAGSASSSRPSWCSITPSA